MSKPTVLLVDGYSLIFRGFHALPLLSTAGGQYTNAVHGFFNMLLKALSDYRPEALCVMLDVHAPTFRHTMYEAYKGTRKPMPEELRPQLPLLRKLLGAMRIRMCEMEGYEADDLLGTAAKLAGERGWQALVLTGDRDSLQLVNAHTQVILTRKGITESLLLDEAGVLAEYGFTPAQVPDMKGLMGDTSDNIPGIPGVGEKTALKLITQYGSLDEVLAHAGEVKGKLGEKLRDNRELALLSRDLGTIRKTAPLDVDFDQCPWTEIDAGLETLEAYELKAIVRGVKALLRGENQPAEKKRTAASRRAAGASSDQQAASMPKEQEKDLPDAPLVEKEITLMDETAIRAASDALGQAEWAALYHSDEEITLLTPGMELWRMPILRDLMGLGLYEDQIYTALSPVLESVPLIVHGAKALFHLLCRLHLPIPAVRHDAMIAAYLLNTSQKEYDLKSSLSSDGLKRKAPFTAHDVYALSIRQQARLAARNLTSLFEEIEQPLTKVLFQMEREGFLVDGEVLHTLGEWFTREVNDCREAVYALSGVRDFNLNSPRQLGEVLFETLKLPPPAKKGVTGYSTSAEVLENLIPYHPCIEPLLRYRKMAKLQSTYIEGLKKLRAPDGRVRTTFDQTATVTGRISSLEPNLQNIPIRTEEGREIRRAFVAKEGCILLDADYSQIELRVLAHMSGDEAMCDAFIKGQDIHARTAAEIHGIGIGDVTGDMRRAAKAVNFGIVYGISGFGLARNARISRKDADHYIHMYFERYPGVRAFMDECVVKGRMTGYAQTLFHRRRELYELASANRNVRSFGERAAMNTPVQGTAADIIKLAMVRVAQQLEEGGYKARLILQVHDELVVECPLDEADAVAALLQKTMENVAQLKVPLVAEVSRGKDWEAAH